MKVLLAVVAVVAMVAACQVEPNVTPIPAATSRHIDFAVSDCRDGAFTRYADSPFRLGWAQAECDKAGEEARMGDWDRGLLPTPSTLSPTPTFSPGQISRGDNLANCAGGAPPNSEGYRYIVLTRVTWNPSREAGPEYRIRESVRGHGGGLLTNRDDEQLFDAATQEQALERHAELCEIRGLALY